jgi:hypothetical protein
LCLVLVCLSIANLINISLPMCNMSHSGYLFVEILFQ